MSNVIIGQVFLTASLLLCLINSIRHAKRQVDDIAKYIIFTLIYICYFSGAYIIWS